MKNVLLTAAVPPPDPPILYAGWSEQHAGQRAVTWLLIAAAVAIIRSYWNVPMQSQQQPWFKARPWWPDIDSITSPKLSRQHRGLCASLLSLSLRLPLISCHYNEQQDLGEGGGGGDTLRGSTRGLGAGMYRNWLAVRTSQTAQSQRGATLWYRMTGK